MKDLSEKEKGEILRAHMFGTAKKKADESFDRYKGRLVADGRYMNAMMAGDTHSPTVIKYPS